MRFQEFLEQYVAEHDLKTSTIKGYRTAINSFEAWAGREVEVEELDDTTFNQYLTWSLQKTRSRVTTKTRRSQLLCLIRYAFELGLTEYEPRRVKPIKTPATIIDVWTVDEMKQLLRAARDFPGMFRGTRVSKSVYFEALIAAAWDTALRRGDLVRIERSWIEDDCTFSIVQAKSGSQKVCRLNESTRQLILSMDHNEPFAFPQWLGIDRLSRIAKRIMNEAGLTSPRGQIFHKVRRSSITHIERVHAGYGWIHGGHSDSQITQKHYINREHAYSDFPTPADIAG